MQFFFEVNWAVLTEAPLQNSTTFDARTSEAHFSFSQEWQGCTKLAVFRNISGIYLVPLVNDSCIIPSNVFEHSKCNVLVIGQRRTGRHLTTNEVTLEVKRNG